jgi:PAB-dependent poly(A)-specific ribonuclease subunit 3
LYLEKFGARNWDLPKKYQAITALLLLKKVCPTCVFQIKTSRSFFNFSAPFNNRSKGKTYQTSQNHKDQAGDEQKYIEVTLPAGPISPHFSGLHSFGLSDDMWRWHRQVAMEGLRQMDPSDPRHKAIPPPYCNAYCLDDHHSHIQNNATPPRSSFGYPSSTFQVVSREDGYLYCIRRFDSVKSVSHKIAATVLDQWSALEHPGLATLQNCFVSQRAVFFVHQFISGGASVRDRFLMGNQYMSENLLWSTTCQLVTVLRRIHGAHLACRTLDSRHVLVQMDVHRLKLVVTCPAILDALEFEARKPLGDLQREDIRMLGYLILSMATGTEVTISSDANVVANCERFCSQNFSRELHNLCMTLIRSSTPPSILDVSRALAGRIMDEYESTQVNLSRMERSLGAEYESGRIARLMMKLGFVNERPEFGPNRRWAQSGDCYVLSLFRDYGTYSRKFEIHLVFKFVKSFQLFILFLKLMQSFIKLTVQETRLWIWVMSSPV